MKYFLIFILLLFSNAILMHAETGEREAAVSGMLRYKADTPENLNNLHISGNSIYESDIIYRIYANKSYRQLWYTEKINPLVRAISDIKRDGLNPDDYHLKTIIELVKNKNSASDDYPGVTADLDIILTDALAHLISDSKFGKVDSRDFNYGWEIRDKTYRDKVYLLVLGALNSDDLYSYIDNIKPKLTYYRNLRSALSRMQFYKDEGGWKRIPEGEVLKAGMHDERIPLIRDRLIATNELTDLDNLVSDYYDEILENAVMDFQIHHNLNPDGVIGPNTLYELNVSAQDRLNQIKVNLERARWISDVNYDKNVIVNIAGFRAYYTENGKVVWSSRLQVGKPYRKTPIFKSEIEYMVFNPSWSVPPGILRNDILPVVKRDPSYLSSRGLEVYGYDGKKISPYKINWSNYSTGVPYSIRQKPGPRNALGRVKFIFPNNFSVYLHDTPNKSLFNRDIKTFSSGCIRIEEPFELAELLLNDKVKWNSKTINKLVKSGKTRTVYLKEPVQIMVMYWTASADDKGNIYFMKDIYGRDKELIRQLIK